MPRSFAKIAWYEFVRFVSRAGFTVLCRVRCHGRGWIPMTGGALVLSNHQSNLDPLLVGFCCDRRLNYLARETLFGFAPFRWLINSLDAIPIDREGMGMAGLKETLRRLKREEMVLIFPEGTRTVDGEVAPFKPGFSALAKRARVPLVPVAIEGAFQSWPRKQRLPRMEVIELQFGEPLWPDEIAQFDDRQLVVEMQRRIEACHQLARKRRQRRCGHELGYCAADLLPRGEPPMGVPSGIGRPAVA